MRYIAVWTSQLRTEGAMLVPSNAPAQTINTEASKAGVTVFRIRKAPRPTIRHMIKTMISDIEQLTAAYACTRVGSPNGAVIKNVRSEVLAFATIIQNWSFCRPIVSNTAPL